MQKFVSFMLAVIAMFLSVFYGYGSDKVTDKLNPGVDDALISNSSVSIEIEGKITASKDKFTVKATNYTDTAFTCKSAPDIEVLTEKGWVDAAKTLQVNVANLNAVVPSNGTADITVKDLMIFHIVKGYTYRVVLTFTNSHETVMAAAEFTV